MNVLALFTSLLIGTAPAVTTEHFDATKLGALPANWFCGVTGSGRPKWSVERDTGAVSLPNVLQQAGEGDFPWCVFKGTRLENGFVETKVKVISGQEDQAGGLVWRWQDADTYFVARINAVENNVILFQVKNGKRRALKSVNIEVAAKVWHSLRVDFAGNHATVTLDGRRVIDTDETDAASGLVGVWTKGESVANFDAFSFSTTASSLTKSSDR